VGHSLSFSLGRQPAVCSYPTATTARRVSCCHSNHFLQEDKESGEHEAEAEAEERYKVSEGSQGDSFILITVDDSE
jgi:hypothetical protein